MKKTHKRLKKVRRGLAEWLHKKFPRSWLRFSYFRIFKRPMDEKVPRTYAEKLIVEMQSQEFETLAVYADKWTVRGYVGDKVGAEYLLPLIEVYGSPDQVPYDSIPEGAYIKLNHGSGYNIIYHAKDKEQIRSQVETWYHEDFTKKYGEAQYRNISRKILVEENITRPGETTWEYSFFCFHGRTEFVQIYNKEGKRFEVDRSYEAVPFRLYSTATPIEPKCQQFDAMLGMAEKLAAPFTFVRVDFLLTGERIYFSELTFSPGAGLRRFRPEEYNYIFGRKLTYDTDGVICRPELICSER